jgi:hypothetical protein
VRVWQISVLTLCLRFVGRSLFWRFSAFRYGFPNMRLVRHIEQTLLDFIAYFIFRGLAMTTLNEQQIYYFELGRFVLQFSKAENIVFLYLSELLSITKDECNAIISGAKVDGCISFIKRVHEARGTEVPATVAECLDKLGPLNKLRNDLLHLYTDSALTITNEIRALPGRVISYKITSQILQDAQRDLVKVTLILGDIICPFEGSPEEIAKARRLMTAPWLYKTPSPADSYPDSPAKTRIIAQE